jgi:hypothetical protein
VNILDENFPEDQRDLLRGWHISCRQIGYEISTFGTQDADIIPLLHRIGRVTFFTQDQDFFEAGLCHPRYCLVWLDITPGEAAFCVRVSSCL